jgi:hypothetical protein
MTPVENDQHMGERHLPDEPASILGKGSSRAPDWSNIFDLYQTIPHVWAQDVAYTQKSAQKPGQTSTPKPARSELDSAKK